MKTSSRPRNRPAAPRLACCACLIFALAAIATPAAAAPEVLGGRRDMGQGDTQLVPIILNNAAGLSNINVTVTWDTAVVRALGDPRRGSIVQKALFEADISRPGMAKMGFARGKNLGVQRGVLAYLHFRAVGEPGEHTILNITVTTAADERKQPLNVVVADGCVCIVHPGGVINGDPDMDGRVTALDAWIALMISVGKEAELARRGIDVARAKRVCDVDGATGVTSTDAAEILRMAAQAVVQGGKPGTRTNITGSCSCIDPPVLDQPPEDIRRDDDTIADKVDQHGGDENTEQAVADAMNWLARHQEEDGHWDCRKYGGRSYDTAVTSLALLTFLGHGNSEAGGKYQDTVTRAIDWLIAQQNEQGLVCDSSNTSTQAYSHAIAGMALSEATAMGGRARTRAAAQKALDYAVNVHPTKEDGKVMWRYRAEEGTGDVSLQGWYIMHMHSAQLARLPVPADILPGAAAFLETLRIEAPEGIAYGYTSASGASARRTAIGALGRIYTDRKEVGESIKYFVATEGTPDWDDCDLYYWYYGTLASFQHGGDQWWTWNDAMKKALVENQREGDPDVDGSWDPRGDHALYWGRVGSTALSTLCLEVYYRYEQRRR